MTEKEYVANQVTRNRNLTPADDTSFAGINIPDEESSTLGFSENCVLEFPKELTTGENGNVVSVLIGQNPTKAVLCKLYRSETDPEDKAEIAEFYVGTLLKAYTPIKNGKAMPREYTRGDVHDWYKQSVQTVGVDATFAKMLGRRMKFTNCRIGQYADAYRANEIRGFRLWDINWADGQGNPA